MRVKERSDYGERLYQARKYAKLSQTELARRADMAQSTLAGLEKEGGGSEKTATLARICGVRVEWLERGDGSMLPDEAARAVLRDAAPLVAPAAGAPDYRSIVLAMADAVDKSGSPISVTQFVAMVEAAYTRLNKAASEG